jgi:hypothetical protein
MMAWNARFSQNFPVADTQSVFGGALAEKPAICIEGFTITSSGTIRATATRLSK